MSIIQYIRKQKRLAVAFLIAFPLLVAIIAIDVFGPTDQIRLIATDILYPIVNLAAALCLIGAARISFRRSRRLGVAWTVLACAQISFVIADVIWAVIEVGLKTQPFPSIADGFYLIYYPLFLLGIFMLPSRQFSPGELVKSLLDMGIVLIAATLFFGCYIFGPLMAANGDESWFVKTLTVAYPVGDLVLIAGLLVLFYRRSQSIQVGIFALLTVGILAMIATDCLFSLQTIEGIYISGGPVDIGWLFSYIFTALAGVLQIIRVQVAGPSEDPTEPVRSSKSKFDVLLSYFPFAWIVAAYLLLINDRVSALPVNFSALAVGVGLMIALVLIRQVIALNENFQLFYRLQQSLEQIQKQAGKLEETNRVLKNEIYERKRAEQRLTYDALHDALTGLPNRALFMDRLGRSIETVKRRPDYQFSVLFLDLDQFKLINDSLGHNFGDEILILIGHRLKLCARSSDTVARLGGDEFVILLEDTKDVDAVKLVAARIQEEINLPFHIEGRHIYVSTSIGVVPDIRGYDRSEDVLRDADIAMYRAKELGKARFEMFDTNLRTEVISRLELENDLRDALENQELILHYQPILSLPNNQIIGLEALCRWMHPKRGLMLPREFIPVAEETALIIPIGKWILQEACSRVKGWQESIPSARSLTINVNISGRQLAQPDFTDMVKQVLKNTGLEPTSLRLEITESVLVDNAAIENTVLTQLAEMGIQFQVDDFGTGYSSLGYLRNFPIHTIKIDQSFVQEIGAESNNASLVRTIVTMAHDLGLEAVAEGVETEEQLRELKNYDCKFGQGYLLSVPMDTRSVERLIALEQYPVIYPPQPQP